MSTRRYAISVKSPIKTIKAIRDPPALVKQIKEKTTTCTSRQCNKYNNRNVLHGGTKRRKHVSQNQVLKVLRVYGEKNNSTVNANGISELVRNLILNNIKYNFNSGRNLKLKQYQRAVENQVQQRNVKEQRWKQSGKTQNLGHKKAQNASHARLNGVYKAKQTSRRMQKLFNN